ncbi:hypothetical protein GMRT_11321 [Giardia muris]|uniref:Uncharacterized protein n=1 Tax=Giardia muris TaxID=5742 RepID=A0A4Z1T131_GIAMU|nr:hypothetical protein GMRT_11321 [Giardia muris]|eukprot:TNJ26627.1 hypothetical protein GMRT_11321 [Giardia muris]
MAQRPSHLTLTVPQGLEEAWEECYAAVTHVRNGELDAARCLLDGVARDRPGLTQKAQFWCLRIAVEEAFEALDEAFEVLRLAKLCAPTPAELLQQKEAAMRGGEPGAEEAREAEAGGATGRSGAFSLLSSPRVRGSPARTVDDTPEWRDYAAHLEEACDEELLSLQALQLSLTAAPGDGDGGSPLPRRLAQIGRASAQ